MVLRRTLPSRLTGAPAPAAAPVAEIGAANPSPAPVLEAAIPAQTSAASQQAAALAAAAAQAFTTPTPVETPAPKPVSVDADFAPPAATDKPRVLEESFTVLAPVAQAAPIPETATPAQMPAPQPAQQPAEPTPPAPVAAAAGPTDFMANNPFTAEKASQPVASRPSDNPLRRRVHKVESVSAFVAPAAAPSRLSRPEPKAAPQAAAPKPAFTLPPLPEVAPAPKPETTSRPVAPQAMPAAAETAAPFSEATPEASSQTLAETSAPTASPAAARAPRKALPRDFAAATITAPEGQVATAPAAPALTLAPEIPVDTRPLDRVDEELIASGIMAGPEGDSLTTALPGGMAVAESYRDEPLMAESSAPVESPFSLASGPTPASVKAPSSSSAASLPWQNDPVTPGWQIDTPNLGTPLPPPDIFKPMDATLGAPTLTPIIGALGSGPKVPPPSLPSARPNRATIAALGRGTNRSWMSMGLTALVLGGVGLFVWNQATAPGGLDQLSALTKPRDTLPAAQTPSPDTALLPPPSGTGTNTRISFASPAPDPNAPIVGDGKEAMPEDISLMAKLQRAIQEERAAKGETVGPVATTAPEAATPELTKAQLDAELAQYKTALVDNPTNPPKPGAFMRDPEAYMDGIGAAQTAQTMPDGTLLPPPANGSEQARADLPPPNTLYTNNPKKLPIVAEPMGNDTPRIRQLEDFAADLFPDDDRKVQIPQGIRPRLSATDFPSMEVLSFVPGRGVVATVDGREGVLLIGESLNGWELSKVTTEVAEFKAQGRSYYVTAQN